MIVIFTVGDVCCPPVAILINTADFQCIYTPSNSCIFHISCNYQNHFKV